jgi:hypothetical protein
MKVKMFMGAKPSTIEEQINAWLDHLSSATIIKTDTVVTAIASCRQALAYISSSIVVSPLTSPPNIFGTRTESCLCRHCRQQPARPPLPLSAESGCEQTQGVAVAVVIGPQDGRA